MKNTLLICWFLLLTAVGYAQSVDDANLEKYWGYRDNLRKRFMKIGKDIGESLPCSVIIPHRQYGQSDQSTGSIMVWRDATITLGYYWSVLATEYKLLSQNGQDVQPTLNELYYAMVAFNRLDMTAEGYLGGNTEASAQSADLNGFFIRDDLYHEFMDNFDNDPAITNGPIQPDPGHPNQMRSDFEGWTNYDTGGMGDEEITTEIQPMGSASLDQLTTVLLGLRLIERLVPNVYVKPTQADAGFYIHDECLLMIKRIVEYLNDTNPNAFGHFSAKEWTLLQGVDETVHNAGYNCIIASYPITEMVKAIFDTPYSEMIGEPGEVRWQFREGDICIEEVNLSLGNSNGQGIDDSGLVDFIENTINGIDDSGFGRAAINALAFGGGNAALGALLTRNEEVVIALATQGSVWGGVHCGTPDCCEAVDGPVILELPNESIKEIWEAFEIGDFPYHANGAGSTTTLATGHITFKIDGLPFNMPIVLPLKASEKMVDDDNVHIMLELATLGNTWGPSYVRTCAQNSHFHHIPLLYDVLHNNPNPSNNKPKSFYYDLLSAAPLFGPWSDPTDATNSAPEWSSANRLFLAGGRNQGAVNAAGLPDPEYRGYFPGIDYMLYYNLYHMTWEADLPTYKRGGCNCLTEITNLNETTAPINVSRKFPDYRAKGIPIESYLAHDLTLTGTAAIMEVKNDFVICKKEEALSTELRLEGQAMMKIYDGNTITVRENNSIIVRSGSTILAGLEDSEYAGSFDMPRIELLPGAELKLESGSFLKTKRGLVIHLMQGSRLQLDYSEIKPETFSDLGIIIINDGGNIELNNSRLTTRDAENTTHTLTNGNVNINDSDFLCYNSANHSFWMVEGSNINLTGNSQIRMDGQMNFHQSNLHCYDLSEIKMNNGGMEFGSSSGLFWWGNAVELTGDLCHMTFDGGTMEIGPNKTFAPTHPSQPSGYIEFKGAGDHELFMNQGSVFKLEGDNSDDIMLKVVDYADLWTTYVGPNPQDAYGDHGSIQLNKCKVEMHNHGRIWTDLDFDAYRVNFISSQNEGVGDVAELRSSWENDFDLKYCNLQQVNVFGLASDLYATSCSFYDSDVKMRYGHYNINASNFQYSSLVSEAANFMCRLTGCQFMDNSCNVTDDGLVELKVDKCTFTGAALEKNDGVLGLHCNYFEGAINPVSVTNAYLSMSSSSANGYNQFYNVSTCVKMDRATGFEIDEGFNDFSGYTQCCICGSLAWSCNEPDCEMWLKTTHNFWGSSSVDPFTPDYHYYPNSPNVEIHLYAQDGNNKNCNVDGEAGMGLGCTITVMDSEPIYKEECGLSKPVVRKERRTSKTPVNANVSMIHHHQLRDLSTDFGNPILGTSNFNNYTLDSALVAAALQMEVYDTLGNDAQAVAYFEEILTSGLDRSNPDVRWRMEWGRKQMKAAIENMFVDKELSASANETAFEAPVLSYVNVLNVMTDTILSDSTYKDQFCVELDKGQLFRTIGQPVLAKYVFEHLGDCQLDSLEQAKLNEWIYEVDIELATKYEFFNDSLSWDTTMVVVDSTLYPVPMDVTQSNYYFGVWIGGPQDVAFVHCGEDLQFRTFIEQTEQWNIYPNPAHDRINLSCPTDERAVIRIYDSMGRMAYQEVFNFGDQHTATIQLGQQWPAGNYMLCKETNGTAAFKRFVVAK